MKLKKMGLATVAALTLAGTSYSLTNNISNSQLVWAKSKKVVKHHKKAQNTKNLLTYKNLFGKKTNDPILEKYRQEVLQHAYLVRDPYGDGKPYPAVTIRAVRDAYNPGYKKHTKLNLVAIKGETIQINVKPFVRKALSGKWYYFQTALDEDDGEDHAVNDFEVTNYNPNHDYKLKSLTKKIRKHSYYLIKPKTGSATIYELADFSGGEPLYLPSKKKITKPVKRYIGGAVYEGGEYWYNIDGHYIKTNSVTIKSVKEKY